ncbi:hypothetical protein [Streptomyces sp. NPDC002491]
MKYTDNGGDTWEDAGPDCVRVVRMGGRLVDDGQPCPREHADEQWGPLRPLDEDEATDAPLPGFPTVEDVMRRASVFQSAHALVNGLKWGEEASVYDVLSVAKWLEGEE